MIIVADSHVSEENGNLTSFFKMLEAIGQSPYDVVFLGDIFDLWIGLRRYEEPHHIRFRDWCRQNLPKRAIGFIEGNHEFYVADNHRAIFTWSSERQWLDVGAATLFAHGDLINRADKNYLRFRRLTKNPLTKALVRFLPGGRMLARHLKRRLKTTNQAFRIGLPEEALRGYARQEFAKGIRHIFIGHFHQPFEVTGPDGGALHVLPGWFSAEQIALLDRKGGLARVDSWREILSTNPAGPGLETGA